MSPRRLILAAGIAASCRAVLAADAPITAEQHEFFENKIRPVLAAECYECHNAKKTKGGLRLDYRDGWKKGGDTGDAIVPGDVKNSLLVTSIRHEDPDLKMPDKSPKLDDKVIADFEKWIAMGAPDPRDEPPTESAAKPTWKDLLATRRTWWSLQPVVKPEPPANANATTAIDRFLRAKLADRQLPAAPAADPRTFIRRLTFTLTGLPPTPEEVEAFSQFARNDFHLAISQATDRLLASPRFGEHWGRHWLDLMRYAETHGSEGDPEIRGAWRYRDYLIRALNADVPLDQLIREHLAGDLLPQPRMNADGFSESALGPVNLRLNEHGFQPVDTLDDQVKAVDNQIDVVTKAFQGFTVSCARCHDHKFDAISERDYYALYSVFASVRPAQVIIDSPERQATNRAALEKLHGEIKTALVGEWLPAAAQIGELLRGEASRAIEEARLYDRALTAEEVAASYRAGTPPFLSPEQITAALTPEQRAQRGEWETQLRELKTRVLPQAVGGEQWAAALKEAANNPANPFHLWAKLGALPDADFAAAWTKLAASIEARRDEAQKFNAENYRPLWNLAGADYAKWFAYGAGLPGAPRAAGEFAIEAEGDRVLGGVLPAGVMSHRLSDKHNALLTSPRFKIDSDSISVRASGGDGAMVRVIVDNYPLPSNPIFAKATLDRDQTGWVRLDTAYRKGSWAYLEFGTREDLTRPLPANRGKGQPAPKNPEGRSHFAVAEVVAHHSTEPPRELPLATLALLDGPAPHTPAELASRYAKTAADAVEAWRAGQLTATQTALLDFLIKNGALPATLAELPSVQPLVAEYRRLEAQVPVLRRAPGVIETVGFDSPLLPRGDHLKPGEAVPRGYLEVLGGHTFQTPLSGRLELAEEIASAKNPLTARVMANRVWHWMFGRGLVPTVDNFGRLGEKVTHPELLDFLAARLVESGWSMKALIREIALTQAFQMSSEASAPARESDPGNEWLSHFRVRRLEAEAIRDSLLAVSGELDGTMFGKPAEANALRRSVYLQVRRTALNPFLQTFDAPKPFTTLGRRDATNVPGQSLTMLNSPFVIEQALKWSRRLVGDGVASPDDRIRAMFSTAYARTPGDDELTSARAYVAALAEDRQVKPDAVLGSAAVWQDFAQSLFNLKEFIYVR